MAFETIFWLVVVLFVVLLGFTIVKKLMKIFFLLFFILFAFSAISGYFLVKDMQDLSQNFGTGSKIALLVDDEKVLSGFVLQDKALFLDENALAGMQQDYINRDFEALKGENYKLFIVNVETFSELPQDTVMINDKPVEKSFLVEALQSNDPKAALSNEGVIAKDIESTEKKLPSIADDAGQLKSALFAMLFAKEVMQKPMFLFDQFKKGNILIYKETIVFKAIRVFPSSVFSKVADKLKGE